MLQSAEISTPRDVSADDRATYWQAVLTEIRSDRIIYAVVAIYSLSAWALSYAIGRPDKFLPGEYLKIWLQVLATLAGLYLLAFELPASVRANPAAPLSRLRQQMPRLLGPRTVAACGLLLALPVLKGDFTSVKNMLTDLSTFHSDPMLAHLDWLIHGGRDPWTLLQPVMGNHVVTRSIQVLYATGWMTALLAIPAIVAVSPRLEPLRLRFFLTYAFCWIFLGNILAGLFLSGGPVYFGQVTGDAHRFAPQMEYLAFSAGRLHSSFDIQKVLWEIHELGVPELGSGISAFPSMHVAMATLFFLLGRSVSRAAGVIGGVFLALIMAGSVHLAWHYAVDGYASFVITTAAWFAFGAWDKRRRAKRGAEGLRSLPA